LLAEQLGENPAPAAPSEPGEEKPDK
jgi:hypothetical protein